MPISEDLLQILCCPRTKVPDLNEQVAKGAVKYHDGSTVEKALDEGLVTEDGKTVYRIDDGIPVMLVDQGIPTDQLNKQ